MSEAAGTRQIRAIYDEHNIRVYQAYSHEIAERALAAQTFVPPFNPNRMTWIKPSFFWMMYRSGWGSKSGQERILAIDMTREGFEWALRNSCLTHYETSVYSSPENWLKLKSQTTVRVQWDPERSPTLERLDSRTIQVGLSGRAVEYYVKDWIQSVTDVSAFARELHRLIECGDEVRYTLMIPREETYETPPEIRGKLGIC